MINDLFVVRHGMCMCQHHHNHNILIMDILLGVPIFMLFFVCFPSLCAVSVRLISSGSGNTPTAHHCIRTYSMGAFMINDFISLSYLYHVYHCNYRALAIVSKFTNQNAVCLLYYITVLKYFIQYPI